MWKPSDFYNLIVEKRANPFFPDFILHFIFPLGLFGYYFLQDMPQSRILLNSNRIISTACYCPSLSLGSMDGLSLQMGCEYVTYKWDGLHTHGFSEIVTEIKFFWVGKDIWLQIPWKLQANEWKSFLIKLSAQFTWFLWQVILWSLLSHQNMVGWGYHYLTHLSIDNISVLSTENKIIIKDLNDRMTFKVQ